MHNLAIALKEKGHNISGSDDEIFEPSRSMLDSHGLLPDEGWDPSKITEDLDAVILGMHAKKDNPELKKAQELNLRIYSFPEYIYEQSEDKQRVVIAGSHGKTTITAMILHVLKYFNREFDYAVGAYIKGFDLMVKLSDAPIIIIEGDEYLSSPLDDAPKFMHYHHHIALISGIAWDHINVFPSEERYMRQFEKFADRTPKGGSLIFSEDDSMTSVIGNKDRADVHKIPYETHAHVIEDGKTFLLSGRERIPIQVFGKHNLQNLSGALEVLKKIGISEEQFYEAIPSFEGAAKRLEVISENGDTRTFKDYAHAPSKVKATVEAVKTQYPKQKLIACLELHTFSSLNPEFIKQYKGSLKNADEALIYVNPDALERKGNGLTKDDILAAFDHKNLNYFEDSSALLQHLKNADRSSSNLLLMSSGNFDNLDLSTL